jgi:hypothetical protein
VSTHWWKKSVPINHKLKTKQGCLDAINIVLHHLKLLKVSGEEVEAGKAKGAITAAGAGLETPPDNKDLNISDEMV